MKRTVAAAAAALSLFDIAVASTASAQEVTSPGIFDGWYAGLHAGYWLGQATFKSSPYILPSLPPPINFGQPVPFPGRSNGLDPEGAIGGAHFGFNARQGSNWLVSAEGDFTWGDAGDGITINGIAIEPGDAFAFTIRSDMDLRWQATLRGRVGYITGNWLFYVTGGVAFLKVDWEETMSVTLLPGGPTNVYHHQSSNVNIGPVVGGGIELALNDLWSARGEYLYEHFGDMSVSHGASTPGQPGHLDGIEIHKMRIGISRKIGGP